jgi:hypothetical protein
MTGSVSGIGSQTINPFQPSPWGVAPLGTQSFGSLAQGGAPFQQSALQLLQQLTYLQQQQLQQIQQLLVLIPYQLQQALQQIPYVVAQQLQQLQHSTPNPWSSYTAGPFGQQFFPSQSGQVM